MLKKVKKHKDFATIIEQINTDIRKWKLLGAGSYGYAYDMGDGRVCKITTNERETKAAAKLKKQKKQYSYLYKVLDVFVLENRAKFKYGLIVTPKYKKLTDSQKTELYELFCFLELSPGFRLRSIEQIKNKIVKAANDYYTGYISHGIINNIIKRRIKIFNKYNILYILRNLKTANLGPEDIHYENILKSRNRYILIDIAC